MSNKKKKKAEMHQIGQIAADGEKGGELFSKNKKEVLETRGSGTCFKTDLQCLWEHRLFGNDKLRQVLKL